MRILQIGKYPKWFSGGIEKVLFELSEYLSKFAKVRVVVSNLGNKAREEEYGSVKVDILARKFVFSSFSFVPSLPGYLRRCGDFEVIQESYPNPMASLSYLLAKPKGKLIVWYHSDIIGHSIGFFFLRPFIMRYLSKASYIVSTSDNYRRSSPILQRFSSKVVTIPLGIDISVFDNPSLKEGSLKIRQEIGTPFVLFIGRLINYKGLRYLITAMKGVKAKLVIIGEGPLEYELRTLAYNLDLEDRVIFLKVPYFEPLGSYIDACDLFVLPSVMRSEAFGLVLLEAMACRKPVVTTELGTGTSFVCLNGVTGIVVPPKDPKALEEAINKILNNPDLAKKFGESGRRRVEEEFGLEKMGDAFLDLYKKVLNR